jgi:hypothetical protein
MFNFENAQAVEKTFERKSNGVTREQKFELKFRSVSDKATFSVSDKSWEKLGLADNDVALAIYLNRVDAEDVTSAVTDMAIVVVDTDHKDAKLFKKSKRGEKNKTFNSDLIAQQMVEAGILSPVEDKVNQYISLSELSDGESTFWVLSADSRDKSEIEAYGSSDEEEDEVDSGEEVDEFAL